MSRFITNKSVQAILLVIAASTALLFLKPSSWREWVPFTPLPANTSALELGKEEKANVLTTLLTQNREEIRFWQDKLFTVSMWFNAAILGIVAFSLQTNGITLKMRYVYALACVILSCFYLIFVGFADRAISVNDHDLIRIQYALQLATEDMYLADNVIYKKSGPLGHWHVAYLVRFNLVLVTGAVFLLVFFPVRQCKCGQKENEEKQTNGNKAD